MIVWVHGAFSTGRCFNYLRGFVDEPALIFEYSERVPLRTNVAKLETLIGQNEVTGIVGHSLGGLFSAIMNKRYGIRGVAISSPLGGFGIANILPMFQVMKDTSPLTSAILHEISSAQYGEDFLSICSSQKGKNSDGVVPLSSQTSLSGDVKKFLDINHFEVLLEPLVGEYIRDHFDNLG